MSTNESWSLLTGAVMGAGAMYLLDPDRGGRRRALIRDKMARAAHKTSDAIDATSRDVRNRASGLTAEVRASSADDAPSDRVLEERVRAELGRVCSHPRAIDVTVIDGVVRLSGPILASAADDLVSSVRSIRGVRAVENQLGIHATADNIPSLQGGRTRPGRRWPLLQGSSSPTTQVVMGLIALVALGLGVARLMDQELIEA